MAASEVVEVSDFPVTRSILWLVSGVLYYNLFVKLLGHIYLLKCAHMHITYLHAILIL